MYPDLVNCEPDHISKSVHHAQYMYQKKQVFTSPPTNAVAPISALILSTSALGPASSEVPVSAMAWQPPTQYLEDPMEILQINIAQDKSYKFGHRTI